MTGKRILILLLVAVFGVPSTLLGAQMGKYKYSDFSKPKRCAMCHKAIYQEWKETLMSQSYTHEWDQVEYFKLALPHSKKLAKVAGVRAGCIACHGPLAFLSGDIPPKPASANTRANEGVSCDVCHSITGTTEKEQQRLAPLFLKRIPVNAGHAVDAADFAVALPDQIRLGTDDRIAPAHFATGDRFQHEAVCAGLGQFQHQGNRRVQIGGQTGIDQLVFAAVETGLEGFDSRC